MKMDHRSTLKNVQFYQHSGPLGSVVGCWPRMTAMPHGWASGMGAGSPMGGGEILN